MKTEQEYLAGLTFEPIAEHIGAFFKKGATAQSMATYIVNSGDSYIDALGYSVDVISYVEGFYTYIINSVKGREHLTNRYDEHAKRLSDLIAH